MIKVLLFFILLVLCWPLALVFLLLFPLIWLLLLPFKLIGVVVGGVFSLISAIFLLPLKILGVR